MIVNTSIVQKLKSPFIQAGLILATVLVFNILVFFLVEAGVDFEQRLPWTLSATFLLFFAIFNSLISLLEKDVDRYWTRSIMSFIALAGLGALFAWGFSSLTINEAGSYKWIYIVLTFGYLLFLSLIRAMRSIVEFAQREEWNQPRARKRKK